MLILALILLALGAYLVGYGQRMRQETVPAAAVLRRPTRREVALT